MPPASRASSALSTVPSATARSYACSSTTSPAGGRRPSRTSPSSLWIPTGTRPHTPSQAYALFEVSDSSLTQDRLTKAPIYAKNGVPQYVLVNLREDCVENYTAPSAPRRRYLERTVLRRGERFTLVVFPDVTIAVDDLLPPRRRARP